MEQYSQADNKTISQHDRHRKNPFMEELRQRISKKNILTNANEPVAGLKTGVIYDSVRHIEVVKCDKEQFLKFYVDEMKWMFNLKPSTQKVFHEICLIIQDEIEGNRVKLREADFWSKELGISSSSYWSAIRELLNKNFLARDVEENTYYFNPTMVFNGNRAEFVTRYEVERQKELLETHQEAA